MTSLKRLDLMCSFCHKLHVGIFFGIGGHALKNGSMLAQTIDVAIID
jgi:hypothetical protein